MAMHSCHTFVSLAIDVLLYFKKVRCESSRRLQYTCQYSWKNIVLSQDNIIVAHRIAVNNRAQ